MEVVRTAYLLQIYHNPEQVNKFIEQIVIDEDSDVYVHIDTRTYDVVAPKIMKHHNVRVIEDSIACEWGDISQIDTTLLLLRTMLETGKTYDYVLLRSGQDLLVRADLKSFLSKNKGKIFLRHRQLHEKELGFVQIVWPKGTRKRYTTPHPLRIYRRFLQWSYSKGLNLLPNRNAFPRDYCIYKGSQWFTMPYDVAQFVVKFVEENEWYYSYFEHSLVPDESFFHTLLMNSAYKEMIVNENLFFMKWGETLSTRNSPQILQGEDISAIHASQQFFARKFDQDVDKEIIDYYTELLTKENKIAIGG